MCACVCVCVCGGGGWGVEGSYIAVVILDIGAPEYYMLTGIRNYVDMMLGCRYCHTNKFSHRSDIKL